MYVCKNYRANLNLYSYPGSALPHQGQVLADLYDGDKFYRTAIVADCGSKEVAIRFCRLKATDEYFSSVQPKP